MTMYFSYAGCVITYMGDCAAGVLVRSNHIKFYYFTNSKL